MLRRTANPPHKQDMERNYWLESYISFHSAILICLRIFLGSSTNVEFLPYSYQPIRVAKEYPSNPGPHVQINPSNRRDSLPSSPLRPHPRPGEVTGSGDQSLVPWNAFGSSLRSLSWAGRGGVGRSGRYVERPRRRVFSGDQGDVQERLNSLFRPMSDVPQSVGGSEVACLLI